MKKALKKTLNLIVDVIIILILMVSILVVALSLTSKSSGVPTVLGIAPLSVQSNSMEDTFTTGDLLLSKVTNDPSITYEVGDVVTFPIIINGEKTLNTHRIIEVVEDSNVKYYRTQGDNKDTNPVPDEELQTSSTIVAQYTGNKIPGAGKVLSFIRTQLGFFLCVLLPMILFFIYEGVRVVMNIIAYSNEKALNAANEVVQNSELTEEQKKRAVEEYLASVEQNKDDETSV